MESTLSSFTTWPFRYLSRTARSGKRIRHRVENVHLLSCREGWLGWIRQRLHSHTPKGRALTNRQKGRHAPGLCADWDSACRHPGGPEVFSTAGAKLTQESRAGTSGETRHSSSCSLVNAHRDKDGAAGARRMLLPAVAQKLRLR